MRIGTRGLRVYDDEKKSWKQKMVLDHFSREIFMEIHAFHWSKMTDKDLT